MKLTSIQELRNQGLIGLDNSMLKNFISCPFYFNLRHEKGYTLAQPEPNTGMMFGVAIHKANEQWFGRGFNDADALQVFIENFRDYEEKPKMGKKKELSATYTLIYGCSLLQTYYNKYKEEKNYEIIEVESPLAEQLIGNIYWVGRVDLIFRAPNKKLRIRDFKSTKYYNDFFINPNPQFLGYDFLVSTLTGEKVEGEVDIFGVSKTGDIDELLKRESFEFTDFQRARWKSSTVSWLNRIDECRSSGMWPMGWNCRPFARSDCQFRAICTCAVPETVPELLRTMYRVEYWDPFHVE
jgi:hypothetical protein